MSIKWPNRFDPSNVGDIVFHPDLGWGTIKEIKKSTDYKGDFPLIADFQSYPTSFTLEGKSRLDDEYPVLLKVNEVSSFIKKACPPPKKKTILKYTFERWVLLPHNTRYSPILFSKKEEALAHQTHWEKINMPSSIHHIYQYIREEV